MGIAINYYILFMDFSAGRSGGSTENRESCFIKLREVCLKMQPHIRQAAGIIGEGALIFTG
jgi:hypothetical protein